MQLSCHIIVISDFFNQKQEPRHLFEIARGLSSPFYRVIEEWFAKLLLARGSNTMLIQHFCASTKNPVTRHRGPASPELCDLDPIYLMKTIQLHNTSKIPKQTRNPQEGPDLNYPKGPSS